MGLAMAMTMSEEGKRKLAEWEGMRLTVYKDVAGFPTIGVGHLLTKDERSSGKIFINGEAVRYAGGLTEQQALDLLAQELTVFEEAVSKAVTVPLTQNQFDALVSFSYNVGLNAFKNSTLLKLLNQGKYAEVPAQLRRWIYAGGKKCKGLVNRREKEVEMWEGESAHSLIGV
jgi:lysozyme